MSYFPSLLRDYDKAKDKISKPKYSKAINKIKNLYRKKMRQKSEDDYAKGINEEEYDQIIKDFRLVADKKKYEIGDKVKIINSSGLDADYNGEWGYVTKVGRYSMDVNFQWVKDPKEKVPRVHNLPKKNLGLCSLDESCQEIFKGIQQAIEYRYNIQEYRTQIKHLDRIGKTLKRYRHKVNLDTSVLEGLAD